MNNFLRPSAPSALSLPPSPYRGVCPRTREAPFSTIPLRLIKIEVFLYEYAGFFTPGTPLMAYEFLWRATTILGGGTHFAVLGTCPRPAYLRWETEVGTYDMQPHPVRSFGSAMSRCQCGLVYQSWSARCPTVSPWPTAHPYYGAANAPCALDGRQHHMPTAPTRLRPMTSGWPPHEMLSDKTAVLRYESPTPEAGGRKRGRQLVHNLRRAGRVAACLLHGVTALNPTLRADAIWPNASL